MGLLRDLVNCIEAAEMTVAADSFFETNSLKKSVLIQSLLFDKKVFKTKAEVVEYLNGKLLFSDQVSEIDAGFVAIQLDEFQFASLVEVEVRRGVRARVGELIAVASPDGYFSLLNDDEIKFKVAEGSKVKTAIEIARIVDGLHPRFGRVTLTKETLASFKANFDARVFGKDIVFDFDHEEREASGWPKSLFLSEEGDRLFAVVDWTPKGFDSLSNREFRYFSPQFSLNYVKPTTGEEFGPTLTGGGITNKPFLDMEPIVNLSSKGEQQMSMIALADHNAALSKKDEEIKVALSAKDKELEIVRERAKALETENIQFKEQIEKDSKNSKFETLLKDGKACEAQREAYLKGDMEAFAAAAVKLNLNGSGQGKKDSDSDFALSDSDKAICAKLNLTEEEYCKANKLGKFA